MTDVAVELLGDATEAERFGALTFSRYRGTLLKSAAAESPTLSIGARADGAPIGLLLAERRGSTFHLLSLAVSEGWRRRGVGLRLLSELAVAARDRRARELEARWEQGRAHSQAVAELVSRAGFGPPTVAALMGRAEVGGRLREAPWLDRATLPAGYRAERWSARLPVEAAALPSHPPDLSPLSEAEAIEHGNSLWLTRDDEIVGWQVTHRIAPRSIRYTALFVRDDLQSFGLAIPMLAASILAQLDTPLGVEAPGASFLVGSERPAMTRFVRRRLGPWIEQLNEVVAARKPL